MLTIHVTLQEGFDEATQKFVALDSFKLDFEHSLATLSKWEEKYEKSFLGPVEKTTEEILFYIHECMLQTENPPGEIFQKFSQKNYEAIQHYIDRKASATTIKRPPNKGARQILTAEVIYGWMVALRIPFETQHWHLNRLLMLVDVVNEQQKPQKKMSRADAARQQAALNAKRRAEMGTRG